MKRLAAIVLCCALACCADTAPPAAGTCADLFGGLRFRDLDGRESRVACAGHRVLVVNFWATWCGPCRLEVPHLNEIARQYAGRGVKVVGISLDALPPARLKPAVAGFGIAYPVLTGGAEQLLRRTGIDGIPATLIFAGDGSISRVLVGYHSKQELLAPIRALLERGRGGRA